mgnify:CR=1 FL=1
MKYLLILLFLFTAQSFANPLKVKGLLCNYDKTHSTPYAFYFNSDYGTYFYHNISKRNDEFSIYEVFNDHKSLEIKFKELKDKYQEEYNKTLEVNKI